MSETPKLLPLGSAVTIEDDDVTYIIIARGFRKSPDGFLAGYKGAPHPHGAGSGVKEVVISQTQIIEVVHRGWENPEDEVYRKERLEAAKAPPVTSPPVAEPDLTVNPSTPAGHAIAPSAQKPEPVPPAVAVGNPRDPFSELRRKGKRK